MTSRRSQPITRPYSISVRAIGLRSYHPPAWGAALSHPDKALSKRKSANGWPKIGGNDRPEAHAGIWPSGHSTQAVDHFRHREWTPIRLPDCSSSNLAVLGSSVTFCGHFLESATSRATSSLSGRVAGKASSRQTLRVTPAMEAGLADHVWEIEELLALPD